jgi:hypothetical protein
LGLDAVCSCQRERELNFLWTSQNEERTWIGETALAVCDSVCAGLTDHLCTAELTIADYKSALFRGIVFVTIQC